MLIWLMARMMSMPAWCAAGMLQTIMIHAAGDSLIDGSIREHVRSIRAGGTKRRKHIASFTGTGDFAR